MDSPIFGYLAAVRDELRRRRDGDLWRSTPALAAVDPELFGICLATVDGHTYEVGDSRQEFSIQSISKAFTYGLALDDQGFDAVDAKVDVEPSGDAFNEISLAEGTGRPSNPMINAGALTVTSLVAGTPDRSRFTRILDTFSDYADRPLSVSEEIAAQEDAIGHRHRAMAYLLRSFGIIETDPEPIVVDYFRQCSILVDCHDLGLMAATLANGGVNPRSGKRVLSLAGVQRVLGVMTTCGMYDDAGEWMIRVGMPGKSGVGGGVVAVLPGQVGLAVFSPRLDGHGNSVRGKAACERLSRDLGLHFVRTPRPGRSVIRGDYDIADVPSGVRRSDEAMRLLAEHGHRARVLELHGDLQFAEVETVIRRIGELEPDVEHVVLDLRRVEELPDFAAGLLFETGERLRAAGGQLVLVDSSGLLDRPGAESDGESGADADPPLFQTRSAAVEWCENALLVRHGEYGGAPVRVRIEDSTLLGALDDDDAQALRPLLTSSVHDDGEPILRIGQRFAGIHFIVSGVVHKLLPIPGGEQVRLSTLSAGMTFGEMALAADGRQHVNVVAEGPVRLLVLRPEALAELERRDAGLALRLWKAMTRDAYLRLDQQLRELAARAAERT